VREGKEGGRVRKGGGKKRECIVFFVFFFPFFLAFWGSERIRRASSEQLGKSDGVGGEGWKKERNGRIIIRNQDRE